MLAKVFVVNAVAKILSAFLGLLSVPLLIRVLGVEQYGLWVALTSIIGWLAVLDFGVGHALKNTVSRAFANDKYIEAQAEAQQVFTITLLMALCSVFLLCVGVFYIDILKNNKTLVMMLYLPILFAFPMSMGGMILQGARKSHIQSLIGLPAPVVILCILFYFVAHEQVVSLQFYAPIYTGFFVVTWVVCWVVACFCIGCKKDFFVGMLSFKIKTQRLAVGLRFFVLQISSVVLYGAGSYLVYINAGAQDAAIYDTVNKLYFFGLSLFNMVIAVFWPEVAFSVEKKQFARVGRIYFTMLGMGLVFVVGAFFVAYFSVDIIFYWTAGEISIDSRTPYFFAALVSVQALAYCGAVVLNAVEKVMGQLLISIISSVAMIPVFFVFLRMGYGIASVPIAAALLTSVAMLYCNLAAFFYVRRGLKGMVYAS
ncbi:O-antigen flippase Wzx [Ectopseudomonas oleovorans]|uniref:Uncharacterized protein n=1 Tax=Ectopseudomonas oleovorans TaxID=301 RepID=A0A653BAP0_ECTOL|nr:O-antigen flippase Wzx [Pseudomonas oleovorans]